MSHIDTWDPKPGRPVAGEFDPINTSADGIQISGIFPIAKDVLHSTAIVSSEVDGPETTSTRGILDTGLKKCIPPKLLLDDMSSTLNVEVFVATN